MQKSSNKVRRLIINTLVCILFSFFSYGSSFLQKEIPGSDFFKKSKSFSECKSIKKRYTRPKPVHTEISADDRKEIVVLKFVQPSRIRLRQGELLTLIKN